VGRVEAGGVDVGAGAFGGRNGARPRGPGGAVRRGRTGVGRHAAMEPGHVGRVEWHRADHPQGRRAAAMEPGHVGRVEFGLQRGVVQVHPAAMEPGHVGRVEPRPRTAGRLHAGDAAMEPGHVGRVETATRDTARRTPTGRNGARPRGPGGAPRVRLPTGALPLPQWSPATWAGWSRCGRRGKGTEPGCRNGARPRGPGGGVRHRRQLGPGLLAAMEPGHVGRVESVWSTWQRNGTGLPQWSPATWAGWRLARRKRASAFLLPQWSPATWAGWSRGGEARRSAPSRCRNGARPRGPGGADFTMTCDYNLVTAAMEPGHVGRVETCEPRSAPVRCSCRNGARPRGPGGGLHQPAVPGVGGRAAMEPGHVGRVEERYRSGRAGWCSGRNGARPRGPGGAFGRGWVVSGDLQPQWSPATWAGWSAEHRHVDVGAVVAAMEPGRVGRVERTAAPSRLWCPAAMEPGHVGRVERHDVRRHLSAQRAAMEPGHVGRVEVVRSAAVHLRCSAAMEPGHVGRVELAVLSLRLFGL